MVFDAERWDQGFAALNAASEVDVLGCADAIGIRCGRVGAILRSVQHRLDSSNAGPLEEDLHALVGVALDVMGDIHTEEINKIDAFHSDIARAFIEREIERKRMVTVLEALSVAASLSSTLEEMEEAANELHKVVRQDDRHAEQWAVFCNAIEARGLVVEIVQPSERVFFVLVHTPASLKASRRMKRKQKAWAQEVQKVEQLKQMWGAA